MSTTPSLRTCSRVFAVLVLLTASVAMAGMSDVAVQVTARAGTDEATVLIEQNMGRTLVSLQGEAIGWTFHSRGAISLDTPGGAHLGTIDLDAMILGDPEVNLNFAVQAGDQDTEFYIASQLLTFPTIVDGEAQASAAFELSDGNWPLNGATLTGIGDPGGVGGAYLSQFNGWAGDPMGPAGSTFAEDILSMATDPGQWEATVDQSFNYPNSGWATVPGAVDSMSSLISFELSANDAASGTSRFVVVPEPSAMALLALLGVVAARRR